MDIKTMRTIKNIERVKRVIVTQYSVRISKGACQEIGAKDGDYIRLNLSDDKQVLKVEPLDHESTDDWLFKKDKYSKSLICRKRTLCEALLGSGVNYQYTYVEDFNFKRQ